MTYPVLYSLEHHGSPQVTPPDTGSEFIQSRNLNKHTGVRSIKFRQFPPHARVLPTMKPTRRPPAGGFR